MGKPVVLAYGVLACAVTLAAQNLPQQPVFRAGVDLVAVDATVLDRDGRPVSGLKAEDFSVTLDGERRPVRALDYLEFGSAMRSRTTAPMLSNSSAPAGATRGGRVILIVVDDLSARPGQMTSLRVAAGHMLATIDPEDLVGVATTSGLGPLVMPTRDRASVASALASRSLVGRNDDSLPQLYVSVPEAIDIDRNVSHSFAPDRGYDLTIQTTFARVVRRECFDPVLDPKAPAGDDGVCTNRVIGAAKFLVKHTATRAAEQIEAYTRLIDGLSRAPAPRLVIALSAGVAVGTDTGNLQELEPISLAAAKAGVQLYALTEVQDAAEMTDANPERGRARREEEVFLNSGVQTIAAVTGGEAFKVVGQADRFFARIVSETSGIYQLGVEAPAALPDRGFLDVKISVNRPGLIVRSNVHALVPAPVAAAVPTGDDALRARLAAGGASIAVPIAIATTLRRDPGATSQVQLGLNVHVPGTVPGPITTMFAVVDDDGRMVAQGRKQMPGPADAGYQFSVPMSLAPGHYHVRVAASDAVGNIGSVEQPLSASLPRFAGLVTSDLLASWSGGDRVPYALALETLPDEAQSLQVSLELYPDDPRARGDVSVRFALVADGETGSLVERELIPNGTGAIRTAAASLPTDQLAPGRYTIRATVLSAGDPIGTVSSAIRKK